MSRTSLTTGAARHHLYLAQVGFGGQGGKRAGKGRRARPGPEQGQRGFEEGARFGWRTGRRQTQGRPRSAGRLTGRLAGRKVPVQPQAVGMATARGPVQTIGDAGQTRVPARRKV